MRSYIPAILVIPILRRGPTACAKMHFRESFASAFYETLSPNQSVPEKARRSALYGVFSGKLTQSFLYEIHVPSPNHGCFLEKPDIGL